jgi:hypothetical protein
MKRTDFGNTEIECDTLFSYQICKASARIQSKMDANDVLYSSRLIRVHYLLTTINKTPFRIYQQMLRRVAR